MTSAMEPFIGTWKLEKSESFDQIMERLRVDPELRKLGNSLKPDMIISDLGDGKYGVRFDTPVKNMETIFKLGEKFTKVTSDSREVTVLVTLEGNVLKQQQVSKDRTVDVDCTIEGDKLEMTIKTDELICVRTYVKAA
ncbi:unnamed protein product [Taenia asiatica]|uniref:FABP domain-containing protein n=1 Tax=Taenia asiatica TaxID=60517 RepID=A0A0R3VYI8_TAEAS|nr:unnamed protein product [Taenia asiatica]